MRKKKKRRGLVQTGVVEARSYAKGVLLRIMDRNYCEEVQVDRRERHKRADDEFAPRERVPQEDV